MTAAHGVADWILTMTLQRVFRRDVMGPAGQVVRTDEIRAGERQPFAEPREPSMRTALGPSRYDALPVRNDGEPDASKMTVSQLLEYGDAIMKRCDATLERVSAGRKAHAAVQSASERLDALNEERSDPAFGMRRRREVQSANARRGHCDADVATVEAPPASQLDADQTSRILGLVQSVAKGSVPRATALALLQKSFPLTAAEAESILADCGVEDDAEIEADAEMSLDSASEVRRRSDTARGRTTCDTSGLDPEDAMVKRRLHQAAEARNRAMR